MYQDTKELQTDLVQQPPNDEHLHRVNGLMIEGSRLVIDGQRERIFSDIPLEAPLNHKRAELLDLERRIKAEAMQR